jgi:hypothetical protein
MSRAPIIKVLVLYNVFETADGADIYPYTTKPQYDNERSRLANTRIQVVRKLADLGFNRGA